MNEGRRWRGMDEEDAIRRLLEEAGPRPELPEEDLARVREAGRAEWRARHGRGAQVRARWPRLATPLGVAAALALAAGAVFVLRREPQPATAPGTQKVASVERATGGAPWVAGRALPAGSEIVVPPAPAALALRMAGGASLRFDSDTRARLVSATLVELERGAIYVDTGRIRGMDVAIRTRAGVFQPFGTQFEVRIGLETSLKVREGIVRLVAGSDAVITEAGRELLVDADGGRSVRPLSAWGAEWNWVLESAPVPAIEGMKVRAFLDWVARETGRRVELADAETASLVDSVVLHGSIEHLTASQAPAVVLPSAGLDHRVADGTLIVFRRGTPPKP